MRNLLLATALWIVALTAVGCASDRTYNGSESFYDQHPQYRDEPAYMHSADDVDVNSGKPF